MFRGILYISLRSLEFHILKSTIVHNDTNFITLMLPTDIYYKYSSINENYTFHALFTKYFSRKQELEFRRRRFPLSFSFKSPKRSENLSWPWFTRSREWDTGYGLSWIDRVVSGWPRDRFSARSDQAWPRSDVR